MARNNRGRNNNNNPEGRNQYSSGWMDSAKERPYTTAAVAAATVGAGVFLWSRRNQISEQLSGLSEQISDWTSNMSSSENEFEMAEEGGSGASMNRGTQSRSGNSRSRTSATSGSTGSTAQSGSSGTNRQQPAG